MVSSDWFTVSFPGTKKAAMKELKMLREKESRLSKYLAYSYRMKRNPDRKGYTIFARLK